MSSLTNLTRLSLPILVKLPDGTLKKVEQCGDVHIGPKFMLSDVLYIPDFGFNLLSVSRVVSQGNLMPFFYASHYALQDHQSRLIVAVGKSNGWLYTDCRLKIPRFLLAM